MSVDYILKQIKTTVTSQIFAFFFFLSFPLWLNDYS